MLEKGPGILVDLGSSAFRHPPEKGNGREGKEGKQSESEVPAARREDWTAHEDLGGKALWKEKFLPKRPSGEKQGQLFPD